MARFFRSLLKNAEALSLATASNPQADLPKTAPISGVFIRLAAAYAAVQTTTVSKVEVLGNNDAAAVSLTGQQLRIINKFLTGSDARYTNGTAANVIELPIYFGRFPGDPNMALPAQVYTSLQLQLTVSHTAAPTSFSWDVIVEQLQVAGPGGLIGMIRRSEIGSKAGAAGDQAIKLPQVHPLRAVYVITDDPENVNGGQVVVTKNNDSKREFVSKWEDMKGDDMARGRFYDETTPADPQTAASEAAMIDFDPTKDLSGVLVTATKAGVDEIELRYTGAAAGTAGNVKLVGEEVILFQ